MAVTVGTSAGFVSSRPVNDPTNSLHAAIGGYQLAGKFTSPATPFTVTELGWWQENSSNQALDYTLAIYTNNAAGDSGNGIPDDLVGSQVSGTLTANTVGWNYVATNITGLSTSTVYWIAIGCESGTANYGYESTGSRRHYDTAAAAPNFLEDPWNGANAGADRLIAIYALYEDATSGLSIPLVQSIYRRRRI